MDERLTDDRNLRTGRRDVREHPWRPQGGRRTRRTVPDCRRRRVRGRSRPPAASARRRLRSRLGSASFAEAGFDAVSFDLTRSFLEEARERVPDASVVRGDMRALPLADGSFDGLWACASLLHVPESEGKPTLVDFERVLVDGGVVLVSMKRAGGDDGTTEESPYDSDERHFERYEPETLTRLFTEAGFTVRDRAADENWVAVCAVA